jgi:hypothetical protein
VRGADLYYDLELAPWEAVLGATILIPTENMKIHQFKEAIEKNDFVIGESFWIDSPPIYQKQQIGGCSWTYQCCI